MDINVNDPGVKSFSAPKSRNEEDKNIKDSPVPCNDNTVDKQGMDTFLKSIYQKSSMYHCKMNDTTDFNPTGKTTEIVPGKYFNSGIATKSGDVENAIKALDSFSLFSVSNIVSTAMATATRDIHILYTNDIHGAMTPVQKKEGGQAGGVVNMAKIIDEIKEKNKNQSLILDAGDWGQGTMESNISRGTSMMDVLNEIHYDAAEIGNHEFDWGTKSLNETISKARIPLLCSNVIKGDGKLLDGVKPYLIKEVSGANIGVLGLIGDDVPNQADPKNIEGLKFLNMEETARKYIDEMRKKGADLIVVLSHAGDKKDEELASKVDGIDVIVGGHSHKTIDKPRKVNNTIIVQAGSQSKQVGHLTLSVTKRGAPLSVEPKSSMEFGVSTNFYQLAPAENKNISMYCNKQSIISYTNQIIPVEDSPIEKILSSVMEETKSKKEEILGSTAFDLTHDRLKVEESVMGDFITDAIRTMTKCDIAFQTSSGIRDQITGRKLTYGDIYRVFPFDNNTVLTNLTGKQIEKVMENSARQNKDYLQVSGISVDMDRSKPDGEKVSNIRIDGKPLEQDRTYRVAINDLLVTAPYGYSEFKNGSNVEYLKMQRDILLDYIRQNPDISAPPVAGRLNQKS